ncbi:MAG: 4-(cytidine 5'-diphospho)-2-C-methyl-D-erythritol kinase [Acidimicrobiales bacterium]
MAPAKLTVSLRVVGRRPDGYHLIESEMVSLDLADTLLVDPGGDGLEVVMAGLDAALDAGLDAGLDGPGTGDDNLVRRALAAAGRAAGVRLVKRVPVGGGLGGGSSDAAAVLRWAGCADLEVAARLGADVPFCVVGGRARVSGIGERVTALPYRPQSYVLLLPPFGVDTGAVYRAWDELGGREVQGSGNDLTAPALAVEPRLATWRDALGEAAGREPILAGSGSTWWVEGTPDELGIEVRRPLEVESQEGRLLAVRTVPAGWAG